MEIMNYECGILNVEVWGSEDLSDELFVEIRNLKSKIRKERKEIMNYEL